MPVIDASTSPFLELEALATPVPDLASTLTTAQAEQDANDANVSFLRTQNDFSFSGNSDDYVATYFDQQSRTAAQWENRAREHLGSESQRRMLRSTAINGRRYSPSELGDLHARAYLASQRPDTGYQGWAPSLDVGRSNSDVWSGLPTMSRSSADFYDERRRTLLSSARQIHASNRESSTGGGRGSSSGSGNDSTLLASDQSLRTTALLQSVRRNPHLSARSRSLLQDRGLERASGSDWRDQSSAPDSRRRSAFGSTRGGRQREESPSNMATTLHDLARRDMVASRYHRLLEEDYRRRQGPSKWNLEDAIKYLGRLRFCDSYQESVSSAAAGGFVREEFFTTNHDDFILDTAMIDPPAESSWLKIGGVFSGLQHATVPLVSPSLVRNRSDARSSRPDIPQLGQAQALPTNRHSFSYMLPTSASRTSGRHTRTRVPAGTYENTDHTAQQFRTLPLNAAAERSLVQALCREDEHWPVKVKIHCVDYENMTLAGTMEAYNVPDANDQTQVPSITTYLEGEIIDFNKHTLETKSYRTDERTDSLYWRMLEPFNKLTDDEMVQGLLSKKWMKEKLRQKYILMRWKGMPNSSPFPYWILQ
ncbi:MAG: hypothetical protein Q9181_005243 [Wetmoreana brouardii]